MSSFNNSVLQLKGGVQMEQEKWLVQMENELFNLAGQIIVLTQTMPHSSEEEWTLATLQEQGK